MCVAVQIIDYVYIIELANIGCSNKLLQSQIGPLHHICLGLFV